MDDLLPNYIFMLGFSMSQAATVAINGATEYQTIQGFGCQMESHDSSVNGSGYANDTAFWDIFFNDIGVSFVRTGAASDTGLGSYLSPFYSEEIWTTYRWAKRYGQTLLGGLARPKPELKDCPYIQGGKLLPEFYDDFAYFTIDMINIWEDSTGMTFNVYTPFAEPDLNEPCDSTGPYNRLSMDFSSYLAYLKVAAPIIKAAKPNIKIYVGLSWNVQNSVNYANLILADTAARRWVDGLAANGYGTELGKTTPQYWQALANLARQYNITSIWVPEVSHCCGNKPADSAGLVMAGWIHDALTIGNATMWQMLLGIETGSTGVIKGLIYSKNWPCPGGVCRFSSNGITKDGYAFRQFAHWVRPGAIRIEAISSDTNDVKVSAYKHPLESVFTIVAINPATSNKTANFSIANLDGLSSLNAVRTSTNERGVDLGAIAVTGNSFSYVLPSRSITTFAGNIGAGPTIAEQGGAIGNKSLEILVSPNPFNPKTTVTIQGRDPAVNLTVSIYDVTGKFIESLEPLSNQNVFVWDAGSLRSGLYIVKVKAGKRILTKAVTLLK